MTRGPFDTIRVRAAERRDIAGWLRDLTNQPGVHRNYAIRDLADAIERGDHVGGASPDGD